MKIIKLLLGIFFPFCLFAQEWEGHVKNETMQPIENAIISLTNNRQNSSQFSKTNKEGVFTFQTIERGKYTITIKAFGYLPLTDTVTISHDLKPLAFILKNDTKTIQLEEVNIKSERFVIDQTANGTSVNVAKSYLKNLPTMSDVLAQIPEISEKNGVITVLGKSNIGYYINGKQSNLNITNIPVSSIERMEIITNPSAKYDASMEAIINIILKINLDEGYSGEITATYEQRAKPRYNLNNQVYYNKGIFNSSVNLFHGHTYTYNTNTNKEQVFYEKANRYKRKSKINQNTISHYEGIEATLYLNITKDKIVSFQASYQPNYVPSTTFLNTNEFYSNNETQTDSVSNSRVFWKYYTRFSNASVKYENRIGKLFFDYRFDVLWQDDLTHTSNDFNFDRFKKTESTVSINTHQFRESLAFVPSINGSYQVGKSNLEFGSKYYYIKSLLNLDFSTINQYTPVSDFDYQARENITALYGNFNSSMAKFTYQLGVRGEFSNLTGNFNIHNANQSLNVFLPSFSISYAINKNQSLNLSYSKKVNRVPFSRLSPLYYFTSPFDAYEGNPFLRSQIANSLQLKYSVGNKYISLYYNNNYRIMGLIPYIKDNITIQQFGNYNQVQLGTVMFVPVQHTKWLSGQYNLKMYIQRNTVEQSSGNFTNNIFTSIVGVTETITLPKSYSANILFNYHFPSYSGVNKITDYPSINFSFSKKVNEQFNMTLFLRDIFKIYNITRTERDFDGNTYASREDFNTRGVSVSLTYKFLKGRNTTNKSFGEDDVQNRL